jgi:hypothetical protein
MTILFLLYFLKEIKWACEIAMQSVHVFIPSPPLINLTDFQELDTKVTSFEATPTSFFLISYHA